jgi:hypothetical protein
VLATGMCLTAALAIVALIGGTADEETWRVLGSAFVAALCTLAGLSGAGALAHVGARRALGRVTILLSTVALALALGLIWSIWRDSEVALRAFIAVCALSPAGAHACLMLGGERATDVRVVRALRGLAIASSFAAATVVAGAACFATGSVDGDVWRSVGVLAVLAVLATLLVPVARRVVPARAARDPSALA